MIDYAVACYQSATAHTACSDVCTPTLGGVPQLWGALVVSSPLSLCAVRAHQCTMLRH